MAVNGCLTTLNLASCNIGAAGALALWHYVRATKCPLEVVPRPVTKSQPSASQRLQKPSSITLKGIRFAGD
jgi:hypothetical protein